MDNKALNARKHARRLAMQGLYEWQMADNAPSQILKTTLAEQNMNNVDQEYLEKTGIKAGNYANFPGGETFVTPESVKGIIIGDVVINIDQSYVIPKGNPLVISVEDGRYKIIEGPKKIVKTMRKEKK